MCTRKESSANQSKLPQKLRTIPNIKKKTCLKKVPLHLKICFPPKVGSQWKKKEKENRNLKMFTPQNRVHRSTPRKVRPPLYQYTPSPNRGMQTAMLHVFQLWQVFLRCAARTNMYWQCIVITVRYFVCAVCASTVYVGVSKMCGQGSEFSRSQLPFCLHVGKSLVPLGWLTSAAWGWRLGYSAWLVP